MRAMRTEQFSSYEGLKTLPLAEAADALRYLVEGRPFGRVVLTI